jgi:hypothetical protein
VSLLRSDSKYTISDKHSRLADDIIETLESIKSWDRDGLLGGGCHQVGEVEKMLLRRFTAACRRDATPDLNCLWFDFTL